MGNNRAGVVAQVVERLPSKDETWYLNPSTIKEKGLLCMLLVNPGAHLLIHVFFMLF
jgi:hypothetical protein